MSKNLLGIVTFGNTNFTKLAVESILKTCDYPIDVFIVVGKPGDSETLDWVSTNGYDFIVHRENMGFPFSVNDIYDYAWRTHQYDNLIIAGNDIVAYPHAVNSMIDLANNSDYECISALQYDVRDLVRQFPSTGEFFRGDTYIFEDFNQRPWEYFRDYSDVKEIKDMQLYDIQNLCLYRGGLFDSVGYLDVNYYPAYFVDNDYARRIVLSGNRCCTLGNARFFHFWSRTIHQGTGGSTHRFFENNRKYYTDKWGGPPGGETKHAPIRIESREYEIDKIRYWRTK